jgi:putative hemolysin
MQVSITGQVSAQLVQLVSSAQPLGAAVGTAVGTATGTSLNCNRRGGGTQQRR